MAAKPLTFDDLYKMNKTQLIDTAAEFNITLTSAKRSEILTELLSKLPVPLDQPESVSKTLENYEDTAVDAHIETGAKPKIAKAHSRGSSHSSSDNAEISLEYEKMQLERERMAFDRHKAEIELERMCEQHRHEIEMKNLELQLQRGSAVTASPAVRADNFRVVDAARMIPKFDQSDLENYLVSFEHICAVNAWPRQYWSAILQTQLTGKALSLR